MFINFTPVAPFITHLKFCLFAAKHRDEKEKKEKVKEDAKVKEEAKVKDEAIVEPEVKEEVKVVCVICIFFFFPICDYS